MIFQGGKSPKEEFMLEPATLNEERLAMLRRDVPDNHVLTAILNVNPGSPNNQGGALGIRARNALNELKSSPELPPELSETLLENLPQAQRSTRTRAYYLWKASGKQNSRMIDLPLELPEIVSYGAPKLEMLEFALESSLPSVIALVDHEWGRIFKVTMGEISELYRLENVLETNNQFREIKPHGAVHSQLEDTSPYQDSGRNLLSRNTTNFDRLEARVNHQDMQFYSAIVERLMQLRQAQSFECLLLAGPIEARAGFKSELTPSLSQVLFGEFACPSNASAAHVLEVAGETLAKAELEFGAKLIEQSQEHGVHGLNQTLTAIQEGRVYRVLVPDDGSSLKVWQDGMGYVYGEYPAQGQSGLDGWAVTAKTLYDVLPELRKDYGVRVDFLHEHNAKRLLELGGLAGLTRF
jgi:Bacterial archaeo-eukaryotic release factor family 10